MEHKEKDPRLLDTTGKNVNSRDQLYLFFNSHDFFFVNFVIDILNNDDNRQFYIQSTSIAFQASCHRIAC